MQTSPTWNIKYVKMKLEWTNCEHVTGYERGTCDRRRPEATSIAPRGARWRPKGRVWDPIRDRNVTETGVVSRERFLPQFCRDSVAQRRPTGLQEALEIAQRGQMAAQAVQMETQFATET